MISFKGLFGLFANYDEVYAADHKYLGKSYGQKKKKEERSQHKHLKYFVKTSWAV